MYLVTTPMTSGNHTAYYLVLYEKNSKTVSLGYLKDDSKSEFSPIAMYFASSAMYMQRFSFFSNGNIHYYNYGFKYANNSDNPQFDMCTMSNYSWNKNMKYFETTFEGQVSENDCK